MNPSSRTHGSDVAQTEERRLLAPTVATPTTASEGLLFLVFGHATLLGTEDARRRRERGPEQRGDPQVHPSSPTRTRAGVGVCLWFLFDLEP